MSQWRNISWRWHAIAQQPHGSDVNKDWTCKDKDKDKDLTHKDQDKDKDLNLVLKELLTASCS